jgi:hypothetical protein
MSTAPNRSSATLLAFVTIVTLLTSPDTEQIATSSQVLLSLARLTEIANPEELSGDKGSPNGLSIQARVRLIEELIELPPATGEGLIYPLKIANPAP